MSTAAACAVAVTSVWLGMVLAIWPSTSTSASAVSARRCRDERYRAWGFTDDGGFTDDWGFPRSRTRAREPSVPARLIGRAEHAERSCPLMALLLSRSSPRTPGGVRASCCV